MIYRKRAYTPPPLRRVQGTEHQITVTAPDGAKLRSSYLVRHADEHLMRDPRGALAVRLAAMRKALRDRLEQYKQGVEI